MAPLTRRDAVIGSLVVSAAALARSPLAAQTNRLDLGKPQPFSYAMLVEQARQSAQRPYVPPYRPVPAVVDRIDYDAHGRTRFRPENALFADGPSPYPVAFFPLGRLFPNSVKMHVVEGDKSREILYSPAYFDMPEDSPARELPQDAGFAGFQVKEAKSRPDWRTQDWAAFLGASYFRAIGELGQYGLSARGLAVDVAASKPEEFPNFVDFYLQGAVNEGGPIVVHAVLEGPSVAGVFRIAMRRGQGVVMDVEMAITMRADVERLGIAPLTSMYWYSEASKPERIDWRPEVHDSDGLAIWSGTDERIWRPLVNPPRVIANAFADINPRGFGLVQRDRDNEHYLDGVNYERRPTCWVEPIGAWGEGSVQLVEIPTDDEIHDNIVAMWVPKQPVLRGQSHDFRYRLHWVAEEPFLPRDLARAVSVRLGRGGEPGKPRPEGVTKFIVDFAGTPIEALPRDTKPEPKLTASRGTLALVFAEPVPWTKRWRVQFDVDAPGEEPVDLHLYLEQDGKRLSETWIYQYHPARANVP